MKSIKRESISWVVRNRLCIGCGICLAACPQKAIKLNLDQKQGMYIPQVDNSVCNICGICRKVCPSSESITEPKSLISSENKDNFFLGSHFACYTGHASDKQIRFDSASGGMVTQSLIYALESGLVDGALVTGMSKKNPLLPEPFIARTRSEIISAARSKYCPVPIGIGLVDIMKDHANERYAVVGLPCHLEGIKKLADVYPRLKNKIILYLGLCCNRVPNFNGTKMLIQKLRINKDTVIDLNYRGYGWPGIMSLKLLDGKDVKIPLSIYWSSLFAPDYFTPKRCLVCYDATAELSDISFGDFWLLKDRAGNIGESLMISRSNQGQSLLEEMKKNKSVEICSVETVKIATSLLNLCNFKKLGMGARARLLKVNKLNSRYSQRSSFVDFLLAITPLYNWYFSQHALGTTFIRFTPLKMLRLINKPYAILNTYIARFRLRKYLTSH